MPLAQIDLVDKNEKLAIHIQNSGVGPLIVTKVSFVKGTITHTGINGCLTLDPKSFQHTEISESTQKFIMAGAHLEIFSTIFDNSDTQEFQDEIRRELASIDVVVETQDIYKNKNNIERSLAWFKRHI